MTDVRGGRPLPLLPVQSVQISDAAAICEDNDGGMAFIWGIAIFAWDATDVCARRLAAVQLVKIGAAKPGEVARGFGLAYTTIHRWSSAYATGGVEALASLPMGPKRPSKLTDAKRAEIVSLRNEGKTIAEVAKATGVSVRSVARVITTSASTALVPRRSSELVPLARPLPRQSERQAARAGLLSGAKPVFTTGASLPLAGSLIILPTLVATGLVELVGRIYASTRAAFYSVAQLVLAFSFAALLGAGRAERAGRIDPVSMGRLIGLDRGPTAHTLRRRFEQLSRMSRSGELWGALAAHHLGREGLPNGLVYLDGHVRAYHGKADLPKSHLARMRIAMRATEDAWLTDALGKALLVWTPGPGSGLVSELREAVREVRSLLAPDAPLTVVFDRGGWSPKLFAELHEEGVDICTYHKNPKELEELDCFVAHEVTDTFGHREAYLLSDRAIELAYDSGRSSFYCRKITRLDEQSGHQTQIITTRADPDPAPLAQAMFGRWTIENFFKYGRARFELDGLDCYARIGDDVDRLVPNPRKKAAAAEVKQAKAELAACEAEQGKQALQGIELDDDVRSAFAAAKEHLESLRGSAREIPAKVALGTLHPQAARLDPERKRICDAIRIASYNAETTLVAMLRPHYARAEDEARTLAQEIYAAPADIDIVGDHLVVRIEPLSAPHRTRALAGLCEELTATETTYPGTELRLVYEVKQR